MHIQLAVHQSNTLLDSQCRPNQARKNKNGGSPKAGTGPIVIPSNRKHNAPKLFRIHNWMKVNLFKASTGAREGFWVLHTFTIGSLSFLGPSIAPAYKYQPDKFYSGGDKEMNTWKKSIRRISHPDALPRENPCFNSPAAAGSTWFLCGGQ